MTDAAAAVMRDARAALKAAVGVLDAAARLGDAEAKKKGLSGAGDISQWCRSSIGQLERELSALAAQKPK